MQPSPYTPGEVARQLPGRAVQIGEFDERLSYLVDLGRLVGRIHVDHAPRGLGKTSLLRQYQRRAQSRGASAVWITAGESHGLIAQIIGELEHESHGWAAAARREIAARLDEVKLAVGVPGVVQLSAKLRRASPPPADAVRAFEAVIRAAAVHGRGLVLLIDELQAADAAGIRTLAYAWQHLQSEGAEVPAAVFAAGLPNTAEVVSSVVSFSERFAYRPLGPLAREAEELALSAPARALGVTWQTAALEAALAVASGYPYLLQLIGDATWIEAGRPDAGAELQPRHVEAARRRMAVDLDALFRARWANASEGERALMRSMASLGDGPTRRADIAAALGVTSESLSVPRARLIDKGFVQAGGRGSLEFTIPGFAEFIRGLER